MFDLAEIDSGFFEALRTKVVALGYLPDRTLFSTVAAYELAKKAIKDGGKELIDVFGVGNYKDRYALQNNKIVIDRVGNRKGARGGAVLTAYKPTANPDKVDEYLMPNQTRNLDYVVTYVCSSAKYDRILYDIITSTLRDRSSLKGVREDGSFTDDTFFITHDREMDGSDGDYIERKFEYTAENVMIGSLKLVQEGVSVVKRIEVEVKGGSQVAGTVIETFD